MKIIKYITNKYYLFVSFMIVGMLPLSLSAQSSASLNNPIVFPTIQSLITAFLNVLVIIAVPFLVFFVIYSGFLYVTAQGNPEKIKAANKSLTYAIIGAVIIIGASAIVTIVDNIVQQF